jgi:endonuclease/exonuclease/phosphatase family metal-dependent hydrolase
LVVCVSCTTAILPVSPVQPEVSADPHRSCSITTANAVPLTWQRPADPRSRQELDRWCAAVGPPIVENVSPHPADLTTATRELLVVSWNMHVGAADVRSLVDGVRDGTLLGRRFPAFVLIVQEALRRGPEVPVDPPVGSALARRITVRDRPKGEDVRDLARSLGVSVAYVPAMRNGLTPEDRGNAVLSTLPIEAVEAIELPFGRQRRVALAATLSGAVPGGSALRVVSVHLDTGLSLWRGGPTRLRQRQARALRDALGSTSMPTIIGADLNTWWGGDEPAVRELGAAFPDAVVREPFAMTWRGPMGTENRLDYVFAGGWGRRFDVRRIPKRFGSDHFPLYVWLASGPDGLEQFE